MAQFLIALLALGQLLGLGTHLTSLADHAAQKPTGKSRTRSIYG